MGTSSTPLFLVWFVLHCVWLGGFCWFGRFFWWVWTVVVVCGVDDCERYLIGLAEVCDGFGLPHDLGCLLRFLVADRDARVGVVLERLRQEVPRGPYVLVEDLVGCGVDVAGLPVVIPVVGV